MKESEKIIAKLKEKFSEKEINDAMNTPEKLIDDKKSTQKTETTKTPKSE